MIACVAAGSNLGDRVASLTGALQMIDDDARSSSFHRTSFEETMPLGGLDQPNYLNAMARFRWAGTAGELLGLLHRVEEAGGRTRNEHWASRAIDLDLVVFGDMLCDTPELRLPHPGLRDRLFWMTELAELESHVG